MPENKHQDCESAYYVFKTKKGALSRYQRDVEWFASGDVHLDVRALPGGSAFVLDLHRSGCTESFTHDGRVITPTKES